MEIQKDIQQIEFDTYSQKFAKRVHDQLEAVPFDRPASFPT